MKILSSAQIRDLDAYTIAQEPIKSIDLMERASNAFVKWFVQQFPDMENTLVKVFCGPGNNGGDGLAIARLLNNKHYGVEVYVCSISPHRSTDFEKNLKRIPRRRGLPVFTIEKDAEMIVIPPKSVIIDALFGSGLNRQIEGYWADLVQYLTQLPNTKVAVDIPSGLYAEKHTDGPCIHANYTLSFELPKLAFFFPENQDKVGNCFIQPIGLNQDFIRRAKSDNFLINKTLIQSVLIKRQKFDHKGTYGHALLIAGSHGKMGAAILATKACLRSGVGLVTTHSPKCGYTILQIACPEAMTLVDNHEFYWSECPETSSFKAIGVGCGLDQKALSQKALFDLLQNNQISLILDADALNILAKNPDQLEKIPPNSILTPHPKEFERLFGKTNNDFERNALQKRKAKELNVIIILKGANTCVTLPDGCCYFNTTGNPGMATGGSGDVLTGILTGLVAQGYTAKNAALLGTYLHGLAGDLAANENGQQSMIAGDIIDYLGKAFQTL